jgi:hypothetical protein
MLDKMCYEMLLEKKAYTAQTAKHLRCKGSFHSHLARHVLTLTGCMYAAAMSS